MALQKVCSLKTLIMKKALGKKDDMIIYFLFLNCNAVTSTVDRQKSRQAHYVTCNVTVRSKKGFTLYSSIKVCITRKCVILRKTCSESFRITKQ